MNHFQYHNNELFAEQVSVTTVAQQWDTPCYIYAQSTIKENWLAFDQAMQSHPHLICYAVKANANLAVLNTLARLGAGFDIVSVGELARVLAAGGDPKKIVFSGIGKKPTEIQRALEVGILCFNVESSAELSAIAEIAQALGKIAPVSLRINPDVDAKTHPYIATGLKENKFGIDIAEALPLCQQAQKLAHIDLIGIDCHIGSQLTELPPFLDALDKLLELIDELAQHGIAIKHLDLGGGLGVAYGDNQQHPPTPQVYAEALLTKLRTRRDLFIVLEPGRAIIADAGILITRVEYLKATTHKNFAIVDAAMNDLLRPALYNAWQAIVPVKLNSTAKEKLYDIVGPVCETGDWLGKKRLLALQPGDLLAIKTAGAYGFVMSSNYNARPRAAEIMVAHDQAYLVRKREDIADLYRLETLLPE